MANYATLKAGIIAAIKENGNNEITGNLLQQQLLAMVNFLGVGYQYAGIATPATNPGTPDQNVFYLASTAGTYANFGGLVLDDGEIAILKYNGAWSKDSTGAATQESVSQLGQQVDDTISVETQAGYNAVSLPHKLKAGTIIYDFSGLNGFYFVGERSNYDLYPTDHDLTKAELPYTLPADIVKVTASTAATLTIRSGLGAGIERAENEIAELQIGLSDVTDDVNSIVGEKETISTEVGYIKKQLSRVYHAGEVVTELDGIGTAGMYFVEQGTSYGFFPNGELHKSQLPYVLEKDTSEVCANVSAILELGFNNKVGILEKDIENASRKKIYIYNTDSQVEILTKMLLAYSQKNTDVFWEHGVYTFDSIYIYMRDTLHWGWRLGLPLGDGCRYFFNNSTIISNAPTGEYSLSRMLFDSAKDGTYDVNSYELYDGHLINNGGTYVIHDEGNSQTPFYQHKYKNLILEYNDDGVGITYPFGCGVGYNTAIYFDAVYFKSSRNACAAIHSVNNHDTPVNFTLSVKDCYFSGASFGMAGFDKTQDNLLLYYCGNSSTSDTDADFTEMVKFNNEIRA